MKISWTCSWTRAGAELCLKSLSRASTSVAATVRPRAEQLDEQSLRFCVLPVLSWSAGVRSSTHCTMHICGLYCSCQLEADAHACCRVLVFAC